jgi:molecular chaperone GrpE
MTQDKKKSDINSIKSKVQDAAKKVTSKNKKETKSDSEKIQELEKQVAELKNDYLRSVADFDNYRKRVEVEKVEIRDKAITSFVNDILPSIDNFEMSLKMTGNTDMFIKGVEMIHKNLNDTLKEHKFEEFSAKENEDFDANKHEPILIEDDSKEPGKVLAVLQKGYMRNGKIVRPVKVQIAKPKE